MAIAAKVDALRADQPTFRSLGVPDELARVIDDMGLIDPLPIQAATIPDALAGLDILGQANTGSGKTLAFAVPLVARLTTTTALKARRPRALVLVPTRELANQVRAVIDRFARAAGLRTTAVFGGVGQGPQVAALRAGTEIVVGCPGRLADLLDQGVLDLGGIEVTVLDEADHMADVGFLPTVERLMRATPRRGQRMLFSATLAGGVDRIVRRYLDQPVAHAVSAEAPAQMDHRVIVVDQDRRVGTILDVVGTQRGVVFTRTKHRARQLARTLSAQGLRAVELHGNLSQSARTTNLRAFAGGSAQVLVATDIAARGIHIDDVPLVVHADVPIERKAYLHRSGRTARAGTAGTVVTIARPDEAEAVRALLRQSDVTATWHGPEVGVASTGRRPVTPRRAHH